MNKLRNSSLLLAALVLSTGTQANETESLKKVISIQEAKIAELERQWVVGSIQQSFLTEAQFQKLAGKNWVLCNGQAVPDTKYASVIGARVPDCTGRFLRSNHSSGGGNVGQVASLRGHQGQANSSTGLYGVADGRWSGSVSGTITGRGEHSHSIRTRKGHGSGSGSSTRLARSSSSAEIHTDISTGGGGHSHGFSGSVSGQLTPEGKKVAIGSNYTETRPHNITVNTFIKVD